MLDAIVFVAGAVTALLSGGLGWMVGRVSGIQAGRRVNPKPGYVCGCGHSLAVHDPKDGECQEDVKRRVWDEQGNTAGFEWVTCPCMGYIGERPIDLATLNLPGLPADGGS